MHSTAIAVIKSNKGGKRNKNSDRCQRFSQVPRGSAHLSLNHQATANAAKIMIRCIIVPPVLGVRLESGGRSLGFALSLQNQGYLQMPLQHQGCLLLEIGVNAREPVSPVPAAL
jgi:hypothetical protein